MTLQASNPIDELVDAAVNGQYPVGLFMGSGAPNMAEYLFTDAIEEGQPGLLMQAASKMINHCYHNERKRASVTFSWFKIACNDSESILDVLKTASTVEKTAKFTDPNMILREIG
jgi:hypothetical protein